MATAITASATEAVVEGRSSREGATGKPNALENWDKVQSTLENKQACVPLSTR